MNKPRISLLQEIENYVPPATYPMRLQTQAEHVFSAIKKLMISIERNCDDDTAQDLKKRFFNAAKSNDFRKFERGLEQLKKKGKEENG